jgi:hypothetical protein
MVKEEREEKLLTSPYFFPPTRLETSSVCSQYPEKGERAEIKHPVASGLVLLR